jgi:hydroxymethylpyrimidine/phosphomethylpyrimidine kinase
MNEDAQDEKGGVEEISGRPVALTIAGFDPSSGAGVTADLKVFAANDIYGMACITALTVQSTTGVRRVEPVAPGTIREILACLRDDVAPAGVKIGMLATSEGVSEVVRFLAETKVDPVRVVLDPVIRSSSGRELLDPEGIVQLRSQLLPHVGWITPNVDELAVLTGMEPAAKETVAESAAKLQFLVKTAGNPCLHVVVTGGDLARPDDFLLLPDGKSFWLQGDRVETPSTHGTGCAFSSALLCRLILGDEPERAVLGAKEYVSAALKAAYPVGQGRGPMHHFFKFLS